MTETKLPSPSLMAAEPQREENPKQAKAASFSLEDLRARRSELAARKRRLIFSNDGGELSAQKAFPDDDEINEEFFLNCWTTGLAGTQVDTIAYCGALEIGDLWGKPETGMPNRYTTRGNKALRKKFLDAGLEPLRMMIDYGHAHDIEMLWSFRMNDTHDGDIGNYGYERFQQNAFKSQNPDCLLGVYDANNPEPDKIWSGVNYALPQVRDYVVTLIRTACEEYDIDGVDPDFFRHPAFFKSSVEGKPATEEEIAAMTSLMSRIREVTEIAGLNRGRPILLSIRVPDSVPFCKAIGLDVEEWLKSGWIDLLVTGGYYRLNPWQYSIDLGHRYGVPVYASLDDSALWKNRGDSLPLRRGNLLCYRARALNAWEAGVDGLYLFNTVLFFKATDAIYRELGDPSKLKWLDKNYFANARGDGFVYGVSWHRYLDQCNLSRLTTTYPAEISTDGTLIPITISDDFSEALKAGKSVATRLRLRFFNPGSLTGLSIAVNGEPMTTDPFSLQGEWLSGDIDPSLFTMGKNELNLRLASPLQGQTLLADAEVEVRYGSIQ